MPSKRQNLHSELQLLLAASDLSTEDRRLILKGAEVHPSELVQTIRSKVAHYHWSRYWKVSQPEKLQSLLWQDAQDLRRMERKSATHLDKLKFRRQARILEDISEWLYEHRCGEEHLQQQLAGSKEDQKLAGQTIDGLIKLCMRAARNGLLSHPYIRKIVEVQRATYNKPLLRKAQMGLESHLPKPIEARQLEIAEMHKRELSLQQIADKIKALDLNPEGKTLGKKGIHKRLKPSRRT